MNGHLTFSQARQTNNGEYGGNGARQCQSRRRRNLIIPLNMVNILQAPRRAGLMVTNIVNPNPTNAAQKPSKVWRGRFSAE